MRRELERAFLAFGMPWRLRSDNGPPFGASAPGGLSCNAIWLIQLGITPEFITPGHPEQNGRLSPHLAGWEPNRRALEAQKPHF